MGKGDIKTKKGKVANGSFGVRRLRKHVAAYVAPVKPEAKSASKKAKPTKDQD